MATGRATFDTGIGISPPASALTANERSRIENGEDPRYRIVTDEHGVRRVVAAHDQPGILGGSPAAGPSSEAQAQRAVDSGNRGNDTRLRLRALELAVDSRSPDDRKPSDVTRRAGVYLSFVEGDDAD